MERGIVSGQHGHERFDRLELVRLTLPRPELSLEGTSAPHAVALNDPRERLVLIEVLGQESARVEGASSRRPLR